MTDATMSNINMDTVSLTAGRDYHTATRYEYHLGAYEIEPTNVALNGEPFPITLHRETGFKTKAAAEAGRRFGDSVLGHYADKLLDLTAEVEDPS